MTNRKITRLILNLGEWLMRHGRSLSEKEKYKIKIKAESDYIRKKYGR